MNWLSIAVAVFLVLMVSYGARRGLVKMIMSFAAVLLAIIIGSMIEEPLEQIVREQTTIDETLDETIGSYVEQSIGKAADSAARKTQELIDGLMLPGILKDSLQQGNTPDNYRTLGVANATEYITGWLSDLILTAGVYVVAFLLVRIGLWIATILLNSLMQLPVLRQLNSLAGAAVGLAVAVLLLWIGGLIVMAGAMTSWGQEAARMINQSQLLSFLQDNNFLIHGILLR